MQYSYDKTVVWIIVHIFILHVGLTYLNIIIKLFHTSIKYTMCNMSEEIYFVKNHQLLEGYSHNLGHQYK